MPRAKNEDTAAQPKTPRRRTTASAQDVTAGRPPATAGAQDVTAAKPPVTAGASTLPASQTPLNAEEEIRRRAYELYEQDGRTHGRDRDHWLRAEAEVLGGGHRTQKRA
jgi:hypothetical protein